MEIHNGVLELLKSYWEAAYSFHKQTAAKLYTRLDGFGGKEPKPTDAELRDSIARHEAMMHVYSQCGRTLGNLMDHYGKKKEVAR